MSPCIGLKPFKDVERDLSAFESEVYNLLNFAHIGRDRDLTQWNQGTQVESRNSIGKQHVCNLK